ncbi:hypothetical protein [Alcaligenes faecalis]|uniref:ATP-binding protein n=1 Tax=Alcaligenes faecalis TaxID=511 RepID=A0AB33CRK4_ALCFA|nr:hypothetical protein [Alcaligenes faecalis]ASR89175.1 hypothetical protein AFA_06785 [Alcaligenes faecalis]HBQ88671.1 hypothetical protein [Alcaligenes faecalis]
MLKFLNEVRRAAKIVKRVSIDLSPIRRLNPCGTLLFVAELHRLLETFPECHFQANRPSDPVVEQLFQHIGLLKLLGVSPRLAISHRRVREWTFHAGTNVDLTGLQALQTRLTDRLGEELTYDLLSAMQEAITNAVHHAYIKPRPDGIKCDNQGWWVFAECSDEGILYLSVCDLGVGIRRTLPLRGTWSERAIDAILSRLGASSDLDAKYIKAALELGATRTGKGNRGKGLDEMLDLVKSANSGVLRIFSDRGMYTYNGRTGIEVVLDHAQSIMGTLVQWSFDTQTIGARELKDEQND